MTRPMPATIDHTKLPIADKKKRQEPERLDRHSQSIKARKHDPLGHLVLVACPPSLLDRRYAQDRHEQAPLMGDGRSANQANQIWVLMMMMMRMTCLLYTSPSPRDKRQSRMPSSA